MNVPEKPGVQSQVRSFSAYTVSVWPFCPAYRGAYFIRLFAIRYTVVTPVPAVPAVPARSVLLPRIQLRRFPEKCVHGQTRICFFIIVVQSGKEAGLTFPGRRFHGVIPFIFRRTGRFRILLISGSAAR